MEACTKTKVIVGMSGGVDSSVAALTLIQAGYQVEGLFMKNWEEDDTETYCSAEADIQDAQMVADKLGIPLHTVNFALEYWDNVFEHFLQGLKAGVTPNPDILCNKEIKFKVFLEYAQQLGADYIATGHYVRKAPKQSEGLLLKGIDPNKDQSYFLHALNREQLEKSLFPIGNFEKTTVRQIAEKAGLITHNKKDSTGICFIGERRFKDFLKNYLPAKPGKILDTEGQEVGQHEGVLYYTIGQRQGLNIGGQKGGNGAPWYVIEKRVTDNILVVVQGSEHPALYTKRLIAIDCHWIGNTPLDSNKTLFAKTRYRQACQPCTIKQTAPKTFEVEFETPQRAVTPGQFVVFYQGDVCLGGGVIQSR